MNNKLPIEHITRDIFDECTKSVVNKNITREQYIYFSNLIMTTLALWSQMRFEDETKFDDEEDDNEV